MIEETGYTYNGLPLMRRTYSSVMEFCEDAKKGYPKYQDIQSLNINNIFAAFFDSNYEYSAFSDTFAGCKSWEELETLCRDGWHEGLPELFDVTDKAVQYIESEIEQFEPQFALTGMDVDVASAIAGLPHDMIDYPLTKVSNIGTTVTICCDVQCRAGVSPQAVIDRGKVIVALALALDAANHQTELWVSDEYTTGRNRVILRTRVKGPNDYIDPAKIMYAYAHPSVQRGLGFCTVAGLPKPWCDIANRNYGHVSGITKDLPEGTLYIEPLFRYTDSPNLATELRVYLMQLGLINEEDL